jgi:hypothetical protein
MGKMQDMNQTNFGLDPVPNKTRKKVFLEDLDQEVPWTQLVALITPHVRGAHEPLVGRPPLPVEVMLRIHCLQLWWCVSGMAAAEELHERPLTIAGFEPRIPGPLRLSQGSSANSLLAGQLGRCFHSNRGSSVVQRLADDAMARGSEPP